MRRNGYLWTCTKISDVCHSISRPRFLYRVRSFGDLATNSVGFFHFICWVSAIFLLPVCLTYWPRNYTTRIDPHVDNSHRVWSTSTAELECSVWWYVKWPYDLDLWPFDLEQLSHMACHVSNPATMFEDLRLFVLELSVITSFIGYHWHCVFGYCAWAVSRDLCVGG